MTTKSKDIEYENYDVKSGSIEGRRQKLFGLQ
jgi:hypothetical protein